ncbi:hypothetical protein J7F03_17760 [Streptomyces sp. ISL-43]|uniref:hypothetical protein n=1 Tax=Streptomyces sp. ISL-43 TaxID=2819183 RepID=UPI001BE50151|nr:hypothetical protein [Streptomyces sp. ISL-43]MBT2448905.1 hypothetical protein [Streptomyces sp. ISL-43]
MPATSRILRRSAVTAVVALAAGALSAYIAVAGDGDGLAVTAAGRFASGYVPYAVIVFLVAAVAPTAVHAVARAVVSQLIMVWGYYAWGPMTNFTATPNRALHYAERWSMVALTAVPIAALCAFAVGWAVRSMLAPRTARAANGARVEA